MLAGFIFIPFRRLIWTPRHTLDHSQRYILIIWHEIKDNQHRRSAFYVFSSSGGIRSLYHWIFSVFRVSQSKMYNKKELEIHPFHWNVISNGILMAKVGLCLATGS
eukprot:29491_1